MSLASASYANIEDMISHYNKTTLGQQSRYLLHFNIFAATHHAYSTAQIIRTLGHLLPVFIYMYVQSLGRVQKCKRENIVVLKTETRSGLNLMLIIFIF